MLQSRTLTCTWFWHRIDYNGLSVSNAILLYSSDFPSWKIGCCATIKQFLRSCLIKSNRDLLQSSWQLIWGKTRIWATNQSGHVKFGCLLLILEILCKRLGCDCWYLHIENEKSSETVSRTKKNKMPVSDSMPDCHWQRFNTCLQEW